MSLHEKYLINQARIADERIKQLEIELNELRADISHDRACRDGMRRARFLIESDRIDLVESELKAICGNISSSVRIIKGSA